MFIESIWSVTFVLTFVSALKGLHRADIAQTSCANHLCFQKLLKFSLIALVAARLGQFQHLLKTRVILILNFTRPMRLPILIVSC